MDRTDERLSVEIETNKDFENQKRATLERVQRILRRFTIPVLDGAGAIAIIFTIYLFDLRTDSVSLFPQVSLEILTPIFFILFCITIIAGILALMIEKKLEGLIEEVST